MLIEKSSEQAADGELIHIVKFGKLIVRCEDYEGATMIAAYLQGIDNYGCEITFDT